MRRPAGPVRATLQLLCLVVVSAVAPRPAFAIEFGDGFAELHGFYQMEFRGIANQFEFTNFNPHQWAHTLNLEAEFDIAPDGFGPFSLIQGFIRVEARYDCVWQSMCHVATGQRLWGDEANRAPSQFTKGRSSGLTGSFPNPTSPSRPIHGSGARLVPPEAIPPLDAIFGIGGETTERAVARTLGPVDGALFALKHVQGSQGPLVFPLGPWVPQDVKANGALRTVTTNPAGAALPIPVPLTLRPNQGSLYSPSPRLREVIDDLDDLDVNFSENELQWNRGASQQQVKELREAYLDLELFDGSLWLRLGRQTIVWGKTELFRAQDQVNPQDIAIATLSSLESSRIALWSARAVWSFWNVGPFQDVRLEAAINLDHFEPTDLGVCGEPYTVFLVCGKKGGAFSHGLLGVGLAGEQRPDVFFDDLSGLEAGLRLEWRWGRFSFAVTDFYGFPDFPTVDIFNEYERNVDPLTGRPRIAGSTGEGTCSPETGVTRDCLTADNAREFVAGNRQYFDVLCSASSGLAAPLGAELAPASPTPPFQTSCALDLFNTNDEVVAGLEVTEILSYALSGSDFWWSNIAGPLLALNLGVPFVDSLPLHVGPLVAEGTANPATQETCGDVLTVHQEALLGTGAFYHPQLAGTDICHNQGIDLFHAEASVLIESFPQFDGPVATRFVNGRLVRLPGARGPGEEGYDPLVDGCVGDPGADARIPTFADPLGACAGMMTLEDPRTGQPFRSELSALSYNFLTLLAGLSPALEGSEGCDPSVVGGPGDQSAVLSCQLVTAVFGLAGARRPEVSAGGNGRFGRRDFLWHGGGEARLIYERRNVLGFSMDFAEDRTKTNWSMEFVWFEDEPYGDTHEVDGWSRHDTLSLTVSVDRPTFVNFLNANRTFFMNAQFFVRWIDGYTDKALQPDGPFSMLATFSVFTGFFQDRLLPAVTLVHELESNSGGIIAGFTYRMTENLSVSTGITSFYGDPRSSRIPRTQLNLRSTAGADYETRTRWNGLSPVADREELYMTLRYTF